MIIMKNVLGDLVETHKFHIKHFHFQENVELLYGHIIYSIIPSLFVYIYAQNKTLKGNIRYCGYRRFNLACTTGLCITNE